MSREANGLQNLRVAANTADSIPLTRLFGVKARFCRSVNLARDHRAASALVDYIITPTSRDVLRRLASGLAPGGTARAWSVSGPYGVGKSACALFAARVLGYPVNPDARSLLEQADPILAAELSKHLVGLRHGGLLPVTIVGSREPLPLAILTGLLDAVQFLVASVTLPASSELIALLAELAALRDGARHGDILSDEVTRAVDHAAEVLRSADNRVLGLLIIVDELGKLLEYAALNPENGDVYLLQALAELASRSGDIPIGLVVVHHQSFAHYADRLSPAQQEEWRKIQQRFQNIAFLEPQGELLRLIGAAIEPRVPLNGLGRIIEATAAVAPDFGLAPMGFSRQQLAASLARCAPLHPVVALVLGRLARSRLAQNERSLFAFLTSDEPFGLTDFLRRTSWSAGGTHPFYRLDGLYDYLVAALGSALYEQAQGKKWAEIEGALDRLPANCPTLAARVVKTIGLLSLLGDQRSLRASEEMLVYCLADSGETDAMSVGTVLAYLREHNIVVFRKHRDSYGLWEGSDVDLDARFETGLNQIDRSSSLASLLQSYGHLRPYVAQRHLHETGTLRFFAPWIVEFAKLAEITHKSLDNADGAIVFVLGERGSRPEATLAAIREKTRELELPRRQQLFFAVPRNLEGLREALDEVMAWEWVNLNTPDLIGDSVARRELTERQLAARQRLDLLGSRCFDRAASYSSCLWLWDGEPRVFAGARALASALSDACGRVYSGTPIVRNELVNRRALSSAAASARRTLVERMLQHSDELRLGITEGFPPELSMYLSVLSHTGLHRPAADGERWVFGPDSATADDCHIGPLWKEIDAFFTTTEGKRRAVSELFDVLRQPPFGIRDGLLPLFLAAALLGWEEEVSLFENGSFLPTADIAAFERLIKAPDQFELQRYRLSASRREALRRYADLLGKATDDQAVSVLGVVRPILMLVRRLPPYARQTRRLGTAALAVRDALLDAREPSRLLFELLPTALGIEPWRLDSDPVTATRYFRELGHALDELREAYGAMLRRLRDALAGVLLLPADLASARAALASRIANLDGYITDPSQRAFVLRTSDISSTDQAWLESLAAGLVHKPPAQWTDLEEPRFEQALVEITRQLRRVEELALEDGHGANDVGGRVVRIGVLRADDEERRDLARVLPSEESAVAELVADLARTLDARDLPPRLRVAALADLASHLLHPADSDTPGEPSE